MGLFWDKLKEFFKKPAQLPLSAPETTEEPQQYERNEREESSEMDGFLDAIDEHVANGGTMIFKKSNGRDLELLKTTTVGDPEIYKKVPLSSAPGHIKPMSKELANRKRRSQQKNWKKWRKRVRK